MKFTSEMLEKLKPIRRDQDRAVEQIYTCLEKQFGDMAPDQPPEHIKKICPRACLLSRNNLINAARHIAMCLDVYGVEEEEETR